MFLRSMRLFHGPRVMLPLVLALATAWAVPQAADADDGDAVALVNGHPISREEFVDVLIEAHGVKVLQQLLVLRVAKQECQQRGVRVTKEDVDAEFRSALERIALEAGMGGEFASEENKRKALQQVLDERGISMAEFMVGMERNAYLRKIVAQDMKITEETLREEFDRTFGAKVRIRHIQINRRDTNGLNEAVGLLNRGSDFADVARKLSKNVDTAARGGEMDPFTFTDDGIPAAIRQMAFSLKPGGVSSPVLTGEFFHILRLEERIAPVNARFEDERPKLIKSLRERAFPQAMAKLATDLFKQASIRILDAKLRPKYEEFLQEDTKSATQP